MIATHVKLSDAALHESVLRYVKLSCLLIFPHAELATCAAVAALRRLLGDKSASARRFPGVFPPVGTSRPPVKQEQMSRFLFTSDGKRRTRSGKAFHRATHLTNTINRLLTCVTIYRMLYAKPISSSSS